MTQNRDQDESQFIRVRFRWTREEARRAAKEARAARRLIEKAAPYLAAMLFFAVISVNDGLDRAVLYGLMGAVFWVCFDRAFRKGERENFEKSPAHNCDVEWRIGESQLETSLGTHHSSFGWEWIARAVQTPRGFLLIMSREAIWLPNHGFSSKADIETLCQFLRNTVTTFTPSKRILI